MHYGVDYYPEHWPSETWTTDARLMREAGFTLVRIAEFAWTKMEPQPGRFEWDWLDQAIAAMEAEGIKVVLGTPTATPPRWLTMQSPEVLFVAQQRRTAAPQSRRFVCMGSPAYRRYSAQIVGAMVERYGAHAAVVGWQIDNEFGCHDTTCCYCDGCMRRFRGWLQERYGSLAALNEAWGTIFWNHTFSTWDEILAPLPTPAYWNPSHQLDWRRFSSATTVSYQQEQIDIIRQHAPQQWITHNFMAFFDGLDYDELARSLDWVSWDNYVPEGTTPAISARYHDEIRGYKHQPFWVIESPIAQVNWTRYNADLRRNEGRLRSWQAIGHGADAIFYFQWRGFRSGAEQFHSAILGADGVPRRLYREAQALGRELQEVGALLDGTVVKAKVAIATTRSNYWAHQLQPHTELLAQPARFIAPWHEALYRRNIATEFCLPTDALGDYALVIAPSLFLLTDAEAANLAHYVEQGGTLVIGPRSGVKEASNVVTTTPLPGVLQVLVGATVVEWAALSPGETRTVTGTGELLDGSFTVGLWRECLELDGATAVARYNGGEEDGEIAITRHKLGEGVVIYVGLLDDDVAQAVVGALSKHLALNPALSTPAGVEACLREGAPGRFLILLNHGEQPATITLPPGAEALIGPPRTPQPVVLPPVGVGVYKL